MNRPVLCSILLVAALSYSFLGLAQQQQAATNVIVPRLIRFGGVLKDADGTPLQGKAGITFGLYKDQDGGAALWLETQNVSLDSSGHYSVLLGATKEEGVPMDLFTSGAAQWLGVQVQGQSEQPRVLLVSVPYALKAGDADTVGGKPASAFMLATPTSVGSSTTSASSTSSVAPPSAPLASVAGSGTTDFVPLWTTSSTLGNSALFQTGGAGLGGRLGIGNKTPAAKLDVSGGAFIRGALNLPAVGTATSVAGANSNSLNLTASVFNSSIGKAAPQTYVWKAEPLFNNTPGASATLNLLFGSGTNTPSETGVLISSGGQIQAPSIFAHNSLHGGTFSANTGSFGTLGIGIIPPQARLDVVGGGSVDSLIGDPGCGVGFAGIGFLPTGKTFGACTNYSLLGDGTNTYINAGPFGFIHFREANAIEPMTISNTGRVGIGITTPHATLDVNGTANISGALSTGNLATQVSTTTFTQSFCHVPTPGVTPGPNASCSVLSMSFTNQLSPVLILANLNGVLFKECSDLFLLLVVDGNVDGVSTLQGDTGSQTRLKLSGTIMALPSLSPGTHSVSVQLFDDFSGCPNGTLLVPAGISINNSSSTIIVREW